MALRRAIGDRAGVAYSLSTLAEQVIAAGDPARAEALLGEALTIGREGEDALLVAGVLHQLAALAWNRGDSVAARARLSDGLTVAHGAGDRLALARSLLLAATLVARDRPERAARLFGAAEALHAALAVPLAETARATLDRVAAEAGRPLDPDAGDRLVAAGRAVDVEAAVREALAALQPDLAATTDGSGETADDPAAGTPPLTTREREVLRLIADGRVDREIARALAVSPRTVTTHTASVLAKLGAPTRAAAAATAVRRGLI